MNRSRFSLGILFFALAIAAFVIFATKPPLTAQSGKTESPEVTRLTEERDEARRTRDQLQRDLDAMTRERVDVDGELTRLKQEITDLKKRLSGTDQSK